MLPDTPIWIEKIDGRGEDARPLYLEAPDGALVIGAFDGLGGAGSGQVDLGGGVSKSEASIAAAHVSKITNRFFQQRFRDSSLDEIRDRLQETILNEIRTLDSNLPRVKTKIKSSMSKKLPTTLAVARFYDDGKDQQLQVFWAGDSRVYRISKSGRLECLTRDHCKHRSSTTELEYYAWNGDASMTNCITGSGDFFIDCAEVSAADSFCIFACSDGLPTAFSDHTEFELCMLSACIGQTTEDKLTDFIQENRTDDVSAAFINFDLEEEHKSIISLRIDELESKIRLDKQSIDYTLDIIKTFAQALGKKQSRDETPSESYKSALLKEPPTKKKSLFSLDFSEVSLERLRFLMWAALVITYGSIFIILTLSVVIGMFSPV